MGIHKGFCNGVIGNNLVFLWVYFFMLNFLGDVGAEDDYQWKCGFDEEMSERTFIYQPTQLWPNARVAYEVDASFGERDRAYFAKAVEDYKKKTCIRWEERNPGEEGYVHVYLDHNTSVGGQANPCFHGTRQILLVGPGYYSIAVAILVHEMLHSLCFGHEMQRHDRDQFMSYADCDDPSQIPVIQPNQAIRPDLYDYTSISNYGCSGGCDGTPTISAAKELCGTQVNREGLSVLDADKLNDVYDCQGCHRHRWYNIETLTDEQSSNVLEFAPLGSDTEPIYICRGYRPDGYIFPGRFRPETKTCEICDSGTLNNVTKHAQVLTMPTGPKVISQSSENYRMYESKDAYELNKKNILVPVGRSSFDVRFYLTLFTNNSAGTSQTFVGKHNGVLFTHSCFNGELVFSYTFQVFGCSMTQ